MARLSDADQGRLPVPRLHPGGAHRARPRVLLRPGAARPALRDPGVALLLLQEPADGAGPVPRARPLHPADEAQEHAALAQGRGADHPPRHRVLREGVSVAQYVVTAAGLGAIAWGLWYFLFKRAGGPVAAPPLSDGVREEHVTAKGG